MKKDYWNRLESRLLDIYQSHPSIRYILTSNADNRKFNFTCFQRDEDLDEINEEEEEHKGLRKI